MGTIRKGARVEEEVRKLEFQSISSGIFGLVYSKELSYNAMYKSKPTVPSMVSCSFLLRQCVLKTPFYLCTKPIAIAN